jgi:hypothetical protein
VEPIQTETRPQFTSWTRWVLLFPAALAAATLANFASQLLGAIASLVGLPGLGQYFLVQVTESIAQPIAFVVAGAKVAPRSRYRVALVLALFYALVMVAIFVASPPSGSRWVIVATSVVGVCAAIGAAFRLRARDR